ncbi:vWA domain-containing protein [Tepidimonas charontis]|jgi:hypothetical protein|uniref:Uncharacterized protein n=1 Tax=Tepidimonas charontis TaxID=2267262 RepID=A0A554XH90_9BURK|nr:hypothetical protein [Tepidimonas charontis]TSE35149.1 hypothetical protein Tchar_00938 [Tepidimonas charontis]
MKTDHHALLESIQSAILSCGTQEAARIIFSQGYGLSDALFFLTDTGELTWKQAIAAIQAATNCAFTDAEIARAIEAVISRVIGRGDDAKARAIAILMTAREENLREMTLDEIARYYAAVAGLGVDLSDDEIVDDLINAMGVSREQAIDALEFLREERDREQSRLAH